MLGCIGVPGDAEHGWCEMPGGSATVTPGVGIALRWEKTFLLDLSQATSGNPRLAWVHGPPQRSVIPTLSIRQWEDTAARWAEIMPSLAVGNPSNPQGPRVGEAPEGMVFAIWAQDGCQDNTCGGVVYARQHDPDSGWVEMGSGAATGGGLSGVIPRDGIGRIDPYPALGRDRDGAPVVAWSGGPPASREIYLKRWVRGQWEEMGVGSATGGGVSDTEIQSSRLPVLGRDSEGNPVLAWVEDLQRGEPAVYVRRWDPSSQSWAALGLDSASGTGMGLTYSASRPALGLDTEGSIIVAWVKGDHNDAHDIYVRRWDRVRGRWEDMGDSSAAGGGVSNDQWINTDPGIGQDAQGRPILAYASWSVRTGENRSELGIHVRRWDEEVEAWMPLGEGSTIGTGIRGEGDLLQYVDDVAVGRDRDGNPMVAWAYGRPEANSLWQRGVYLRRWLEPVSLPGGPFIETASPRGPMAGNVRQVRAVDVVFSEPIDAASLTADHVAFEGPNGLVPVRRIRQRDAVTFRLTFPLQTSPGVYRLTLGLDIRDLAGNAIDQDQDGVAAEDPEDRYTTEWDTRPLIPRLVLDYTRPHGVLPAQEGGFLPGGSFARNFLRKRCRVLYQLCAHLDFNADSRVDANDIPIAIQKIEQRVAALFRDIPNGPRIVGGGLEDVTGGTDFGQDQLEGAAQDGRALVNVIYVGGRNFTDQPISGVAFQAPQGFNLQHYGFVFDIPLVRRLGFVDTVAAVIAHEYGHLIGLGHVAGHPLDDTSVMNYSTPPAIADFPNRVYPKIELVNTDAKPTCGPQNPYQELVASFSGSQPIFTAGSSWQYPLHRPPPDTPGPCDAQTTANRTIAQGAVDELLRAPLPLVVVLPSL